MNHDKKIFFSGIVLIFFCLFFAYFFYISRPTGANQYILKVSKGDGVGTISRTLNSNGLIRSRIAFEVWSIFTGNAHKLKPGIYDLNGDLSMFQVINLLVSGPPDLRILISEGKNIFEIQDKLSDLGISGENGGFEVDLGKLQEKYPFLSGASDLEGFLFPDTYNLSQGSSLDYFFSTSLTNFSDKALPDFSENEKLIRYLNGEEPSIYQVLKMASIIEKEVPNHEDRLLVSGILWKRYLLGIPFQVDSSVVYAKCLNLRRRGEDYTRCNYLNRGDFKLDSKYNTYLNLGFPPTPISNPGEDAIIAALNPKKSAFLYYLSDPKSKKTVFSKTFEEHNVNRQKYLNL